ncbi:MAG TPA: hypothetical protein PLX06_01035 [Fimbriimonadaceae bacterium]|nr:hypothetical protein [Fimbriimonadaceae bacterium]
MIISALAVVICPSALVATFTPLGWQSASINGTTYTAPGQSLPTGWTQDTFDTVGTRIIGSAGASRLGTQVSTGTNFQKGKVNFGYMVIQGLDSSSQTIWLIDLQQTWSASASGQTWLTSRTGSAQGACDKAKATIKIGPSVDEFGPSTSNRSRREWHNAGALTWSNYPYQSGLFQATPVWSSPFLMGSAKATNPSSAGNYPVVTAAGSGTYRFKPMGLRRYASTAGFATGSVNTYGDERFCIDLFNGNGAPVEDLGCNVISGNWVMSFDDYADGDYRLYGYASGSLRKRIDVTWSTSAGLTGVDFSLKYGDLNMDNYISQAEVDYIYAHIGITESLSEEWFGTDSDFDLPYKPYDCDLNRDGSVTIADYNLAAPNVGQYGD